jgi:hypothetical protein
MVYETKASSQLLLSSSALQPTPCVQVGFPVRYNRLRVPQFGYVLRCCRNWLPVPLAAYGSYLEICVYTWCCSGRFRSASAPDLVARLESAYPYDLGDSIRSRSRGCLYSRRVRFPRAARRLRMLRHAGLDHRNWRVPYQYKAAPGEQLTYALGSACLRNRRHNVHHAFDQWSSCFVAGVVLLCVVWSIHFVARFPLAAARCLSRRGCNRSTPQSAVMH